MFIARDFESSFDVTVGSVPRSHVFYSSVPAVPGWTFEHRFYHYPCWLAFSHCKIDVPIVPLYSDYWHFVGVILSCSNVSTAGYVIEEGKIV